jgi:uncharacterized MAPEG superfamily protein
MSNSQQSQSREAPRNLGLDRRRPAESSVGIRGHSVPPTFFPQVTTHSTLGTNRRTSESLAAMASLITTLGLRAPSLANLTTPNYAAGYVSFHFIFAYCVLAPRHLKQIYGIDNQVSPREDLAKYGDSAVKSGKITQKTLEMMKRNESAQLNSTENYILFVGAMSFATFAGVEPELINRAGLLVRHIRIPC